jgi:hypothetical protein
MTFESILLNANGNQVYSIGTSMSSWSAEAVLANPADSDAGIGMSGGGIAAAGGVVLPEGDVADLGGIGGGVEAGGLGRLEFWREKLLRLVGDEETLWDQCYDFENILDKKMAKNWTFT